MKHIFLLYLSEYWTLFSKFLKQKIMTTSKLYADALNKPTRHSTHNKSHKHAVKAFLASFAVHRFREVSTTLSVEKENGYFVLLL